MAAHTKIIDLYGLPACGKSSLCDFLSSQSISNIRIGNIDDAKQEIRHASLIKLLSSFSLLSYIAGLRLALFFPAESRKQRNLKSWLNNIWIRKFIRKYSSYDYIIYHHGIPQSIVSWQNSVSYKSSEQFKKLVSTYLNYVNDDIFVYCKVDIDTAINRIKKRGRTTGRLDILVTDENALRSLYSAEQERFDTITEILRDNSCSVIEIDCNKSLEVIKEQLLKRRTIVSNK